MRRPVSTGAALLVLALVGCSATVRVSGHVNPPVVESIPASTTTTTTPPATSTTTTTTTETIPSLLVIGDWGAASEAEGEVAAAMKTYAANHQVEAVLTTGDNFYIDDGDAAVAPFDWVKQSGLEWWVTWGNHDVVSQRRIDEVNRVFSSPPRWTTVDWGGIDIVILDSDQIQDPDQIAFLDKEMKRIEKPTIVVFHHPPLNCSVHGDSNAFWEEWASHFDNDVVLVLSGHAHNYQRFEDQGVEYVVTGGGGRKLYGLDDCPPGHVPRVVGDAAYHYVALTQTSDQLELTAITTDGEVIDDVSIPLTSALGG
jgi:Icc-related predicted phosphoesterase